MTLWNINDFFIYNVIILIVIVCTFLYPFPVQACDIPVFKYALTYWSADPYEVIVLYRGSMSSEEKVILDKLEKVSSGKNLPANFVLKTIDLAGSSNKLWETQVNAKLPWMALKYPEYSGIPDDVWSGRLNADNVTAILDSPVRGEITKRLTRGEAGVWVLLETGIKQQDDDAAKILQDTLAKTSTILKIPVQEDKQVVKEIKAAFSMVRMSRKDPGERVFVQMLLHSEMNLKDISKSMAFPVFGRGRVLYALVGEGISESNIRTACSFLTGWCSCQVKDQNPGLDILMSANWNNQTDNESLTGTRLLSQAASPVEANVESNMKRNILIVLLIQIVCVGIITCAVLWKRKSIRS